nr:uncharacterized protein LOC113714196 [Coffea arabica]
MRSRSSKVSSGSSTAFCNCGLRTKMSTCWCGENPGRRFLGCSLWPRPERYSYFEWVDEPICPRGRVLIPGLLKKINKMEEQVERTRKREKILITIIVLLVVLLVMSWRSKGEGKAMGGKLLLTLE